jgi:hypothetical protein
MHRSSKGWKKRGLALGLAVSAALALEPRASHASDHIDGVKTALDNSADLTDLYTFTSPTDPDKLVLVMNVHGLAFSGSRFSNAVDYKFRIRPIDDARTLTPSRDPAREQRIVCQFRGSLFRIDGKQRATCAFELLGGLTESISFDTRSSSYRAGGEATRGDLRVFAGVRSDTWFLDLAKTLKYNAGVRVSNTPGINGLYGQNVLSIVVELDKRRLGGPLLAITAQTVRK